MSDAPAPQSRIEIEVRLHKSRAWILETFAALDERQLTTTVTQSEGDPDSRWSAKDHFVHLALIENDWVDIIRRHLASNPEPVPFFLDEAGRERSMDEVVKAVHAFTEGWAREHKSVTLSDAVAITEAARGRTLQLLSELRDEQLTEKVHRAPWGDGTIGGILARNADHAVSHFGWVREGWSEAGIAWEGPESW